jgi:hypothetical protein
LRDFDPLEADSDPAPAEGTTGCTELIIFIVFMHLVGIVCSGLGSGSA